MQYASLQYVHEDQDPSLTIETEELLARVIDNTGLLAPPVESPAFFNATTFRFTPHVHHLGYHGIRTLYNREERRNVVAPFVSWLNLQGVTFQGMENDPVDERSWAGVARGWPLRARPKGKGAIIHMDPLPKTQMEYSLELQPAEPDGIDFAVRFTFGRKPQTGRALFKASWPCYMNAYDDVRLFYPRGDRDGEWHWHGIGEKPDIVLGETVRYEHRADVFYAEEQAFPVGYGLIGDYCLILMFSDPSVQLFVNNTGGHFYFSPVQNPAWDFQWAAEDYPIGEPVGFEGRLIYTKFKGPDAVLERYAEWASGHPRGRGRSRH